jgi:PAS domain S-box-containing protein
MDRLAQHLMKLSALPQQWLGLASQEIAAGVADALVEILDLDFTEVRLASGAVVSRGSCSEEVTSVGAVAEHPLSGGGWLAIGSRTAGFPGEVDRVVLEVAANLAGVALAQAEAVHKASQQRDSRILEIIGDAFFGLDREWRITHLNSAAAQAVGREPAELLGRVLWEEFPSLAGSDLRTSYARALEEGVPVSVTSFYPELGSWFEDHVYPNGDGAAVISRDVTEKKQAEAAVQRSEERLRLALESGRMGVWDWNVRTGDLKWSESLELLHGLKPGTFGGTFEDFAKLIHPADWPGVERSIERAISELSTYDVEMRNVRADGTVHWVAVKGRVFAGGDGEPERMVGICLDVTKRKREEQTAQFLAAASAELAVLVDFNETLQKVVSLAVPYFADWAAVDLWDQGDTLRRVAVAHVDPAKLELAHEISRRFPPQKCKGGSLWRVMETGKSELVRVITDEAIAQSVESPEYRAILQDLGLKSFIGVPLKVRGKTIGVLMFVFAESGNRYEESDLAVAEDLAARTAIAIENAQLYRELRDADRRKDEFLATLAHELRNPLAPLRNSLQILGMNRVDPETAKKVHAMMDRQVDHLVRLVDDLLDVSRVMRGKVDLRRERTELATAVARAVETCQPLIDAHGHVLEIDVPADCLPVDADPVRLAQVFGNLLTNAARYTPAGGLIRLRAWREEGLAVVSLTDNGIGIDADTLPHVFDLFVQADHPATRGQGGLGIGLTLVKSLVELHGGTVVARSAGRDQGCEFIVKLPLDGVAGESGASGLSVGGGGKARTPGHRVLVVDDNVDAALSFSMLLELMGHEVRVVHDGPAALKAAADFLPELVFLDIGMPGMDGYEVARGLRKMPESGNQVLVALTGWGQEEDRRRTGEAGFDHHLVKPPDPQAVELILAALPVAAGRS